MKIKCQVCNKEYNEIDFEFHLLKPEREKEERERLKQRGGWGYSIDDLEEKHKEAFEKTKKEAFLKKKTTCKLCGGKVYFDYWENNEAYSWTIKCEKCGILFDED